MRIATNPPSDPSWTPYGRILSYRYNNILSTENRHHQCDRRLILHIFATLGQFEVELQRERTRTALAGSLTRGRIGSSSGVGRHQGQGGEGNAGIGTMTAAKIARHVGCSASTLQRPPLPDHAEKSVFSRGGG